jgi:hypothetical protein
MGKLILCTGKIAEQPYVFKTTKVAIRSMEELCYYIYHNVETLSEDLYQLDLIEYIRTDLGLSQRADYLEDLLHKKVGIKDLVVSLLCSADYYDKSEINHLLTEIDLLYRLKPVQRRKRQADYFMKHQQWKDAIREYRNILNSKEFTELSSEEYGDILHNMGVLEAKTGAFVVAANKFFEAYERNNREESLKQYLFALKLSNQVGIFEREVKVYVGTRELLASIEEELYRVQEGSEYSSLHADVNYLKELKQQDKVKEYDQKLDEMMERLKENYRRDSL